MRKTLSGMNTAAPKKCKSDVTQKYLKGPPLDNASEQGKELVIAN